jgi:general secretion pathway protein I
MNKRSQSGMTLLEIVIALAVLALGLAAMFDTIGLGTNMAARAEGERQATSAAQSLLAELGRSRSVTDGVSQGQFPNGQAWQLAIEPMPGESPIVKAHHIRLSVGGPGDRRDRALVFETILLDAEP